MNEYLGKRKPIANVDIYQVVLTTNPMLDM